MPHTNRSAFYLEKVQEIANLGFWELDLMTGSNWWSPQVYRIFALKNFNSPPPFEDYLKMVHPEDRTLLKKVRDKALLEGTGYTIEIRIINADGKVRWIRNHATVDSENGIAQKIFGVVQDITSQVNLQISNIEKIAHSEDARIYNTIIEMAGGIAHEINNPLAIIGSKASLIKRRIANLSLTEVEKIQNDIEGILHAVNRAATIVNNLRALNDGLRQEKLDEFSVKTLIESVISLTQNGLIDSHIQLRLEVKSDLKIFGDFATLLNCLLALINNSKDALDLASSSEKYILIKSSQLTANSLIISVFDNGPGISEIIKSKIMNPFFTTKAPGKGTGLGLSQAKRRLEKYGGLLQLTNNHPGHTQFDLIVPFDFTSGLIPLDVDQAIKAHVNWKQMLLNYSANPDKSLNADHVCKDDVCSLGKWLFQKNNPYQNLQQFNHLIQTHKHFHLHTGEIVRRLNEGEKIQIEKLIDETSMYSYLSSEIILLLNELKSLNPATKSTG